ncbi:MAG: GmrSD restriction endonuclease domain-containing protein [Galactobacter sp.]
MAAIFKTVSWPVAQLVAGVTSGLIQLPDLQRPFVWPSTKVRDLFDSMYRGYPVGALMFWDVPGSGDARGINLKANLDGSYQIIDGQQRLTSLYAAMEGSPVRDESYHERKIVISFNPFSEKFEVRTPVLASSVEWVEDISIFFASPIAARKAFVKRYEASGRELTEEAEERIEEVFSKLNELKNYRFDVIHIQRETEKKLVADVFVRINSEGVRLKSADFILTWLSVFWPEGREKIEEFARNSRLTPQGASEIAGVPVTWTPINNYLAVETGHVVRMMVAVGQRRGRLQQAYAALQAKDKVSGFVDAARQESEMNKLKTALDIVTNQVSWREYMRSIRLAGFLRRANITSTMNVVYSYVLFLLGRTVFEVPLDRLRNLIARWLFMSQLTGRYTGSSESQIQKDMDRLDELASGDAAGFEKILTQIIDSQLTDDYWTFSMPQDLVTSGTSVSPHYQCYLASLNILKAKMFMLEEDVSDWMDPSQPAVKGTEGHHLFPRAYQEKVLGITDFKRINQVANFAPTDWATNIKISDNPPSEYWPLLVEARSTSPEWLRKQMYWHALPDGWERMSYDTFLEERRKLMAKVTRDAYLRLAGGVQPVVEREAVQLVTAPETEVSVAELVDRGVLHAGDLLDPSDGGDVVDAVISDSGTLQLDGTDEFDFLSDAMRVLGISNVEPVDYWALETEEGLVPLRDRL